LEGKYCAETGIAKPRNASTSKGRRKVLIDISKSNLVEELDKESIDSIQKPRAKSSSGSALKMTFAPRKKEHTPE
jgi:hypothetical protein